MNVLKRMKYVSQHPLNVLNRSFIRLMLIMYRSYVSIDTYIQSLNPCMYLFLVWEIHHEIFIEYAVSETWNSILKYLTIVGTFSMKQTLRWNMISETITCRLFHKLCKWLRYCYKSNAVVSAFRAPSNFLSSFHIMIYATMLSDLNMRFIPEPACIEGRAGQLMDRKQIQEDIYVIIASNQMELCSFYEIFHMMQASALVFWQYIGCWL